MIAERSPSSRTASFFKASLQKLYTYIDAPQKEIPAAFTGSRVLAVIAIALAMLNVAGGFLVTHRMLLMFGHKKEKEEKEA
jgi:NAD/NADP transhydrogenase alpha subunit